MKRLKSLKALKLCIFAGGIFDIFGGIYFSLLVGTNRNITQPPTHTFYAILIALFLFSFAYLQLMSAINIRHYLFNIGVVIFSRVSYAILFFTSFLIIEDFPTTFLPTAIADLILAILLILLALLSNEVYIRDLFLPKRGDI